MITLDGTSGITTPDVDTDGLTVDTNTLFVDAANNRVGIGTTAPSVAAGKGIEINGGASHARIAFKNTATGNAAGDGLQVGIDGAGLAFVEVTQNQPLRFSTNNTERLRITSAGNVGIGTSSPGTLLQVEGTLRSTGTQIRTGATGSWGGSEFNINWTGSAADLWIDTTNIGVIQLSSDYRIKRSVETQTQDALPRVMQLRPVTYQPADYGNLFKARDEVKEGFIAHELAEVVPSAVLGEKDSPDQIQSLKLDALVSVLTKAIQEQQALIEALEARVAALETNA